MITTRTNFRFYRPLALAFAVAGISCILLSPASLSANPLTRDAAIEIAFQNNRELAIAALEIRRAESRLRWSGRLENPEMEIEATSDGIGNDENEGSFLVGFSQSFPLTSRLRDERHLRRYEVILAKAEIAARRRELAGEVDRALVEWMATREKVAAARELVALNRKIAEFLKEQAEQGLLSSLDVMQATLDVRTLEQQEKALLAQQKQDLIELNRILGTDPETSHELDLRFTLPEVPPSTEVSLEKVLQRRPDHALALARIDEARAAIALEEAKRWEDISVRLFVEQDDAVDEPVGFDGNTFAGFGVSIPLPLRNRNQEGIEQAQIDREAAAKGVEALQFEIRSECEEAFQLRHDAWKLARDASGEILVLANRNLEEFQAAYQQGQASLLQVQRAREQVLELRTAAVDSIADYQRAAAEVRFVTGAYPSLSPIPVATPRR